MAQFALARKRKLAGETVHAYTSVYSPYGGNTTHLKFNALDELCQPDERKATTWKTRAGAEKRLKELQANQTRNSSYNWAEYEVVELGLTNAELRDNLSRNFRDVLAVLKSTGNLALAQEVK